MRSCFLASSSETLRVLARPLRYSSPMPYLALTIVVFQRGPSVKGASLWGGPTPAMPSERAASATICNFFAVFISGAFCLVVVVLPARRRPPWWAKRDGLSLTAGVQGL